MNVANYSLLVMYVYLVLAYLFGSIPFGYLIGRIFFQTDIRKGGSGNIGATNAMRRFGSFTGVIVLILDLLKGFFVVILGQYLFHYSNVFVVLCGACVVLGHVFPIFLGFKGGKGVATAGGVFLALSPIPLLITILCFIVITWITRFVSVGSVLSAVCFHILALSQQVINNTNNIPLVLFTTLIVLLLIFKHQDNLARLLNGTENKIQFNRKKRN